MGREWIYSIKNNNSSKNRCGTLFCYSSLRKLKKSINVNQLKNVQLLSLSSMWVGDIGTFWAPKSSKKVSNIPKDFQLHEAFMHNVLCQNVPIFSLYILLPRGVDTFWSEGIDTFWSGGIETVSHRKWKTKISNIHKYLRIMQTFHE